MNKGLALLITVVIAGNVVLSTMRDAKRDETLYLRDAAIMADCLREGKGFGNEGVGLHGSLFKLPAALGFIIAGTSVFHATLTTVLMGGLCLWAAFCLLRRMLPDDRWALAACVLLAVNFQFLRLTPTFNRDIPVLLAVLVFLNAVLSGRNRWVLGLLLLVVLEAKEYVFFVVLPPYLLWVILDAMRQTNGKTFFGGVAARWTAAILPALAYLVLMFCTSAVPLNAFNARILGLTEPVGADTLADQFNPQRATDNPWARQGRPEAVPSACPPELPGERPCTAARVFSMVGKYIVKLLYPVMFSFDGVPKALALPAVFMSLVMFGRWLRAGDRRGFPILALWSFLIVFLLIPSFPRYLVPMYPVLYGLLILFLLDTTLNPGVRLAVFLATCAYVAAGLWFTDTGFVKKVAVNAALLALMAAALFARRPTRRVLSAGLFLFIAGAVSLVAAIRYTRLNYWGQVGNYLAYGKNRQIEEVVAQFAPEERFWVNDAGWKYLLDFHTGQHPESAEWEGRLKTWVPKKALLKRYPEKRAHDFWCDNIGQFRRRLRSYNIERVGLVVSEIPDDPFPFQGWLRQFNKVGWLEPEQVVRLQNKKLHLFRTVRSEL